MEMGSQAMAMVKEIRSNKLSARKELSGRYHLLSDRYLLQSELLSSALLGGAKRTLNASQRTLFLLFPLELEYC